MKTFDDPRSGNGTYEWADFNENIARGCEHNCRYCYAAADAKRFKLRERGQWDRVELTKKAFVTHYPKRDGVIMFPTAHDITPDIADACVRVLKLMLQSGNKLLIVSKPHLSVITMLCSELAAHKDSILFRFSIGTTDAATAAHWEPGAPLPVERVQALEYAFASGFRTSISAEPLLGGLGTAQELLHVVRPFVTDTVWIGKMNKIRARVDMTDPRTAQAVQDIERDQSDENVLRMFDALNDDALVRWKDSVTGVVSRRTIMSGGDNPVSHCEIATNSRT